MDTDVQRDQLLALEAWEAAITAYALEARTLISTALACVNSGVPFARPSTEALAELLDRRVMEERALRACVGTLSRPDGTHGHVPRQAAAAGPVTHQDGDDSGLPGHHVSCGGFSSCADGQRSSAVRTGEGRGLDDATHAPTPGTPDTA